MEYSPKKMKDLLNKNNFSFKKKFGQNFIIDENIINNIVKKSGIDKDTLVIEVGPGAGSLTCKLAEYAKQVIAYEIDKNLSNILNEQLAEYNNVEVIYEDFLKTNPLQEIKKYKYKKLYLVANLPYYITTPIIEHVISEKLNVDKIVVMVQKEVGDRLKAKPGTKDYGSLTVFLNYYYDIKKLMDVSANVFIPVPNVDSIVVEMSLKQEHLKVNDETKFFNLIRDSFKQKRKTLRNNLKGYDLESINEVLKKYNYDLNVRAEQLPLEVFVAISEVI